MKTPHSYECRRAFAHYDGDCARCRELHFGAAPRDRHGRPQKRAAKSHTTLRLPVSGNQP